MYHVFFRDPIRFDAASSIPSGDFQSHYLCNMNGPSKKYRCPSILNASTMRIKNIDKHRMEYVVTQRDY